MASISSLVKGPKLNGKSRPAHLESLSPRQEQVLKLLARGYKNKIIADQLGLSINTVSTHMKQIFARLHVNSRAEAAVCYVMSKAWPTRKQAGFEHSPVALRLCS
jgi:DNA-binding NarL/FixJ family response regulator